MERIRGQGYSETLKELVNRMRGEKDNTSDKENGSWMMQMDDEYINQVIIEEKLSFPMLLTLERTGKTSKHVERGVTSLLLFAYYPKS